MILKIKCPRIEGRIPETDVETCVPSDVRAVGIGIHVPGRELRPRDVCVCTKDTLAAVTLLDLVCRARWWQAETRADFEGFSAENIEAVDFEQVESCNSLRVGDRVATISRDDVVMSRADLRSGGKTAGACGGCLRWVGV